MCHFPIDTCKICSLKDVCQMSKNSQCFEACNCQCNECELGQEHCSKYVEEKFSNMIPPSFLCSPSKLSNTHRSASKSSRSSEKRRAAAKKQEEENDPDRKDELEDADNTTKGNYYSVSAAGISANSAMQGYGFGMQGTMQGAYGPVCSYDYRQDARQACTNISCEIEANASEAPADYYNAWPGHTNGQANEIKTQPVASHKPAAGLPSPRLPPFNPCTGEEYKEPIDPLRYVQCPLYVPPAEPPCFDTCFYDKPPIYEPARMQEICPCQPNNKLSTVRFCEASQTPNTFCCNGKAGRHCCSVGLMSGQKQKRDLVKPTKSKTPDVAGRSRSLTHESRPKISEPKVTRIKSSPTIAPMDKPKEEDPPKEIKADNSETQNAVETRSCGCNVNFSSLSCDNGQNADQDNATTSEPMCQRCMSPCCYMCGNSYPYPCCSNYYYNYCNPYYWPYCFGCYCYNSCCQSCPVPQPANPMTPKTQNGATTNNNGSKRESVKSRNSVESKTKEANPRMHAGTLSPFNHNSQSANPMSRPWAAHQQFSNFNMNPNPHMCHSTFCSYGPQQQAASCPISMSPQQRRLRPQ